MANTDVYLNLVGGVAKLQNVRGSDIGLVTLNYLDTMTIHVGAGFGGTTSLTNVEITTWVAGTKGAEIGSWPDSTSIGVVNVGASGLNVVVTDNDEGDSDVQYGYGVTATSVVNGKGTAYTADPALLVRKKRPRTAGGDVAGDHGRPPEAEV